MSLLKLLSKDSYIMYNKTVAKKLGVESAILLGELCSIANIKANEDNEFFFTQDKLSNDTSLSIRAIRQATETLVKNKLLTVTRKGNPCRNWYFLNEENIINLIASDDEKCKTSYSNIDTTSNAKSDTTSYSNIDTTSSVKSDTAVKNTSIEYNINTNNNIASADADTLFELSDTKKNNTDTKKIKSDKKTESDYKKVIDCFYTLFEKTCGYKPTWNNRLGGDVKRLLKIHIPEELCRRLKNYFTCDDNFIKKNISWSGFIANIDKPLIVKISSQGVDNTSGYEKAISDAEARGLTALANALREEQEDKKTGAR